MWISLGRLGNWYLETDTSRRRRRRGRGSNPVSYMSSWNRVPKSPKFPTHRSLLIATESPLSHPPGYLVNSPVNHPASNRAGCSPSYPVRNPENYLACCSVSYSAGYPERNSASCSESCRESNWEDSPSDCPGSHRASNPESNLPINGADNLLNYSESNPADSPAGCLGKRGLYRAEFDASAPRDCPRFPPACRAVVRFCSPLPTPYSRLPPILPRHYDLLCLA